MPNLMAIVGTGDSGRYETDSNTLTAMMEIYLPASLDHLKAVINERVTGSPKGDDTYQCSANNVMECLMILADFATGEAQHWQTDDDTVLDSYGLPHIGIIEREDIIARLEKD